MQMQSTGDAEIEAGMSGSKASKRVSRACFGVGSSCKVKYDMDMIRIHMSR